MCGQSELEAVAGAERCVPQNGLVWQSRPRGERLACLFAIDMVVRMQPVGSHNHRKERRLRWGEDQRQTLWQVLGRTRSQGKLLQFHSGQATKIEGRIVNLQLVICSLQPEEEEPS